MKKIIVNASGAKVGGAKTIVQTFVRWIELNDSINQYIIIVGFDLETKAKNINIIKFSTSGFFSLLFSVFGVIYFALVNRTNIILSFMNLNVVFPFFKRITYFHQAKFFEEKNLRFLIYRFFMFFQKNSTFICQNDTIKKKLEILFHNNKKTNVINLWPGVYIPINKILPNWFEKLDISEKVIGLCPYSDVRMSHKGFEDIYKSYEFFKNNNIIILVTSDKYHYIENDVFLFCGNCTSEQLHYLYERVDFVIFNSNFETVGLPIFEAQYYSTPVVLKNADYVKDIVKKFENMNFILLDSENIEFKLTSLKRKKIPSNHTCFSGEWNKIQEFL